jgi:hypothetical protein
MKNADAFYISDSGFSNVDSVVPGFKKAHLGKRKGE